MRSIRRSGITALTAAIALGIAGVPLGGFATGVVTEAPTTTTIVPATETGPAPYIFPAGTLTLTTDPSAGTVTWDQSDEVQSLAEDTSTFCDLVYNSAYVEFTGTVPGLSGQDRSSFRGGSIGVNEGLNSGQCNRIDVLQNGNEKLALSLNTTFAVEQGVQVTSASLNIKNRASGTIIVARAKAAGADAGTYELRIGSLGNKAPAATVGAVVTTERSAGNGSNFNWVLDSADFDTLELEVRLGSFQLEGGVSGGGPTTFELVSNKGDFNLCDGTETESDGTADVTFVGNASGTECKPFAARLTGTDQEVTFLKPLGVNPDAQFIFSVDWKLPGSATPEFLLPTAEIDFELVDEELFNEMPFCPDYLYTLNEATGMEELTGITESATDADRAAALADLAERDMVLDDPDVEYSDGTQFACLGEPRIVNVSGTEVLVTDKIYLLGDAKMILK